MLVQFCVQNYKSIRDRCELSLVASNYFKENEADNVIETGRADVPRLLKSIVIYGPNAAGKSTLVDAINFVENFVTNSANKGQVGERIDVSSFKLSPSTRGQDSEFEVNFIADGVRYEYGICVNPERVTEEWLIAYPHGLGQKWFHRVYDAEVDEYFYKYSKLFEGGRIRSDWQRQTRQNASYLSTAVQLNNTQLRPVYEWFSSRVATLRPGQLLQEFTAEICVEDEAKNRVVEFIRAADIPLSDIEVKTRKFLDMPFPDSVPQAVRDEMAKALKDKYFYDVEFVRQDDEGGKVRFDISDESDGTQALFKFAGPWMDVISRNLVLFLDELDSSLHPLIVHHLIGVLHASKTNAQIIFTTHDTTILSQKILRRDQIWFVKKDKRQSTILYPLSDYEVRDKEAIEKGYLTGRYGAIPFIRDIKFDGV